MTHVRGRVQLGRMKELTMRIRTGFALCLLTLTLWVAGCGGGGSDSDDDSVATVGGIATPSSSTGANGNNQEAALRHAQCIRENGVPDYPDPKVNDNGGVSINAPEGIDEAKLRAAEEKCKQFAPGGGEPQRIDEEKLDQARQFAKCMRENGVPRFPDPDENGGIALDDDKLGMDPTGPQVKAAEKACQRFMGGGGNSGTNQGSDSGDN
ncbi:hypothetical protein ABGB07_35205 [Micromonosporaceae bacterium B7E4]